MSCAKDCTFVFSELILSFTDRSISLFSMLLVKRNLSIKNLIAPDTLIKLSELPFGGTRQFADLQYECRVGRDLFQTAGHDMHCSQVLVNSEASNSVGAAD